MSLGEWLIVLTFISWILYDVITLGKQKTLSQIIKDSAWKCTAFPACFGFLIGHWFGSRDFNGPTGFGYAIPFFGALGIFDILWEKTNGSRAFFRHPLIYVVLGIIMGVLVWPQNWH